MKTNGTWILEKCPVKSYKNYKKKIIKKTDGLNILSLYKFLHNSEQRMLQDLYNINNTLPHSPLPFPLL